VVLCARRYQFDPSLYPRVGVVYCPFDDDASQPFTPAVTRLIIETVNHLHKLHERGANLLITCQAGLNRSALVAALTMQSFGVVPHESVRLIRKYRSPECLFNERFERIALGLPA
jgi:protein-tyrosine phosphatase